MANILILEDEPALRCLISEMLEDEGHDVTAFGDGLITTQPERLARFDLLITDIMMPEVDGLEAIRRVALANPDIAIIAMSGGGERVKRDYLPTAEVFGATMTLKKPFRPAELIQHVRALLGTGKIGVAV